MQLDNKKVIFGWAMYDWANSAFATTILAGFFPVFFKRYWSAGADVNFSTFLLGMTHSIAGLTVAILAPILGAIADKGTAKKKFLLFFACIGIVMTSSLYLVSQGNWPLAVILFVFASVGFEGGNVFYDALITGVASEKKLDFVSALGYSFGYLGGGILFALNVWMLRSPETFGFAGAEEAVKVSFLSVAIWWAIFSIPIFLFVREPEGTGTETGMRAIKAGFTQLKETFQEVRHIKTLFLFLAAYWLYIDGVHTVIRMAVDYGISIFGFDPNSDELLVAMLTALLITQFVGFPAAIGFGYLGNKIGAKRTIFLPIAVYLGVSIWGAFMREKYEFYILAIVIGLVQGGIQALSRSFYAKLIPVNKSAEYFGFYNMLGKFAAVIGPSLIGVVGLLAKSLGASSNLASRLSITSLSVLFLAGGLLFYFVNEEKAKKEIQYLS